jgi:hypothetical protein
MLITFEIRTPMTPPRDMQMPSIATNPLFISTTISQKMTSYKKLVKDLSTTNEKYNKLEKNKTINITDHIHNNKEMRMHKI